MFSGAFCTKGVFLFFFLCFLCRVFEVACICSSVVSQGLSVSPGLCKLIFISSGLFAVSENVNLIYLRSQIFLCNWKIGCYFTRQLKTNTVLCTEKETLCSLSPV